mmetsp:Transcript_21047/g.62976  ORF Transcript_21047/g.62976 Transcript_21047/m.62976 type:complete len:297 (+) Transcript_21047:112-1002(+)
MEKGNVGRAGEAQLALQAGGQVREIEFLPLLKATKLLGTANDNFVLHSQRRLSRGEARGAATRRGVGTDPRCRVLVQEYPTDVTVGGVGLRAHELLQVFETVKPVRANVILRVGELEGQGKRGQSGAEVRQPVRAELVHLAGVKHRDLLRRHQLPQQQLVATYRDAIESRPAHHSTLRNQLLQGRGRHQARQAVHRSQPLQAFFRSILRDFQRCLGRVEAERVEDVECSRRQHVHFVLEFFRIPEMGDLDWGWQHHTHARPTPAVKHFALQHALRRSAASEHPECRAPTWPEPTWP